jgi:NADH:ubiquinone oxidoreductase subunit 6 (subunit J)
MLHLIVFCLLAAVALGSAVCVVCLKNLVHAVLSMIICFIGVAGLYYSLQSDFMGAVQILVYSSAIAIVTILGLLLIKRGGTTMDNTNLFAFKCLPNMLISVAFGVVLVLSIFRTEWTDTVATTEIADSNVHTLAADIFTNYPFAFLLMGVTILAAIVATVIFAEEVKKDDA